MFQAVLWTPWNDHCDKEGNWKNEDRWNITDEVGIEEERKKQRRRVLDDIFCINLPICQSSQMIEACNTVHETRASILGRRVGVRGKSECLFVLCQLPSVCQSTSQKLWGLRPHLLYHPAVCWAPQLTHTVHVSKPLQQYVLRFTIFGDILPAGHVGRDVDTFVLFPAPSTRITGKCKKTQRWKQNPQLRSN